MEGGIPPSLRTSILLCSLIHVHVSVNKGNPTNVHDLIHILSYTIYISIATEQMIAKMKSREPDKI